MRFIRKHKNIFLILTLGFFLGSLFVGVGSVIVGADSRSLAAKVGSAPIQLKSFEINYRQTLDGIRSSPNPPEITPQIEQALRADVLRELIIRELFAIEAAQWGMKVTDREIAEDVALRPAFQKDGRFDPNLYAQFVFRTLGVLPKEFEAERKKEIINSKLRGIISWSFPPSPQEMEWLYRIARPTATAADFSKERAQFANREQSETAVATLNQYLNQLVQKHPIKTYLE